MNMYPKIYRTKREFVEGDLERALEEGSRSGQLRKLNTNGMQLKKHY
jgi:hypothetical protein